MQPTTTYPVTYPVFEFEALEFTIDISNDDWRYQVCFWVIPNTKIVKIVKDISEIPENDEIEFISLCDSWFTLQKNGCVKFHQHCIRNNYHALAIAVLRWAIENGLGDTIPVVYRGVRDDFPDPQHLVIFGSPDLEVAKFYGDTIKEYHNVKGIKYASVLSSVTGYDDYIDEEVIFFPDQNGL